ncbi:MAG: hypothetical protein HIU90_05040 [Proteobacteria bacterium]|nr:hypothetical protein [Pseudomonadota bacterium]
MREQLRFVLIIRAYTYRYLIAVTWAAAPQLDSAKVSPDASALSDRDRAAKSAVLIKTRASARRLTLF